MKVTLYLHTAPFFCPDIFEYCKQLAQSNTLLSIFFAGPGIEHLAPKQAEQWQAFKKAYPGTQLIVCSASWLRKHTLEDIPPSPFDIAGLATWMQDCLNADEVLQK